MKTRSLWGKPPSRFYRFLTRVENEFGSGGLRIGILGCSDGKFVLPPARKGYKVLAIDIDQKALFGGVKTDITGEVNMEGLVSRLKREGLSKSVKVLCCDFTELKPNSKLHAVWTSGAINYSYNLKHEVSSIIDSIKLYIVRGGFIYFDYMMPIEPMHHERANYFKKDELVRFFKDGKWKIIYNKVMPIQLEKAHVDMPVDHYHQWGHLCVQLKYLNE